jgi:thioredoxin 1
MSKFNELINGDQPVLVDFSAEWCGPCKTMAPILSDVVARLKGRAKVIKVDIDKNPQAADAYHIRSVPTLLLFKKGEIKWQQSGVVPAQQLMGILEKFV